MPNKKTIQLKTGLAKKGAPGFSQRIHQAVKWV
jgi:hypothetical protein